MLLKQQFIPPVIKTIETFKLSIGQIINHRFQIDQSYVRNYWEEARKYTSIQHLKDLIRNNNINHANCINVLMLYFYTLFLNTKKNLDSINSVWRGLFILAEKLITETFETEQNTCEIFLLHLISIIQLRYSESSLQNLIKLFFRKQSLPFNPTECFIINSTKYIIKIYNIVLSFQKCTVKSILELTYLLTKFSAIAQDLECNIYKLGNWLQSKKVSLQDIKLIFNIITLSEYQQKMQQNDFSFQNAIQSHYKTLNIAFIKKLFDSQQPERDHFLVVIIQFMVFYDQNLIQVFFNQLNYEKSRVVVIILLDYINFHILKEISVKKVKLLLRNLRLTTPNDNSPIQYQKLKVYISLLKEVTKKYPERNLILEFGNSSNLNLQNITTQKQTTLLFLLEFQFSIHPQKIDILSIQTKKNSLSISFRRILLQEKKYKIFLNVLIDNILIINEPINIVFNHCNQQYFFCITNRINKVYLHLNSIEFELKDVNFDFNKLEFGKFSKDNNSPSFQGKLKLLVLFNDQVKPQFIFKQWNDSQKKNHILLKRIGLDKILFKMTKGQQIFKVNKQKSLMDKLLKKFKFTMNNITKHITSSLLEILEQLGNLDCIMYFVEYLNETLAKNLDSLQIIQEIFVILKHLCFNDEYTLALDWMENSLSTLAHLIWLIFSKNPNSARSIHLIIKILDFMLFFERKLKQQKNQPTLESRYRILECQIVKRILFNFEIWIACPIDSQKFILKIIEKRLLTSQIIFECIVTEDCIDKLYSSLLIYYTQNQSLTQNQLSLMHKEILKLTSLILNNPQYLTHNTPSKDIKTLFTYIYISQCKNPPFQTYQSPEIFQKLLNFFYDEYLLKKLHFKELRNHFSFFSNFISSIEFFKPSAYSTLIKIIIQFTQIEQQEQIVFLSILKNFDIRWQKSEFNFDYYFIVINEILDSNLKQKTLFIDTFLQHLYKSIQTIKNLPGITNQTIENQLFALPNQTFDQVVNSYYFFHSIFLISKKHLIDQNLFLKIFLRCFAANSANKYIPFFQNFFENYQKILVEKNINLHENQIDNEKATHYLIQYIDSNLLFPTLMHHKLLTSSPPLHPFPSVYKGQSDYSGGTLSHYLSKNHTFKLEELQFLKSNFLTQCKPINQYYRFQSKLNLVELLLPDILFGEILRMIYKNSSQVIETEISSKSMAVESSTLLFSNSMVANKDIEELLSFLLELPFEEIFLKIKLFKKVEKQINQFLTILEKDPNNNQLKNIYLNLHKMIVQNCNQQFVISPTNNKNSTLQNFIDEICFSFVKLRKEHNLNDLFSILDLHSQQLKELLPFIEKYSKKDMMYVQKMANFQPNYILIVPQSKLPRQQQEENINKRIHFVNPQEYKEIFTTKLKLYDQINQKAEESWRKIVKKNMFWILNRIDPNGIYEVDLHECPNFYYLNIKPTGDKKVFAKYGRKIQIQHENNLEQPIIPRIKNNNASIVLINSQSPKQNLQQSSNKPFFKNSTVKFFCEYITQRGVYFGQLYVKTNNLYFSTVEDSQRPNAPQYRLSTSDFHKLKTFKEKKIQYQNSTLFTRRYILRHTAIQIFTKSRSYFFNLFFEDQRKNLINLVKTKMFCIIDRKEYFTKLDFTKKWLNGEYNNFQYLMILNRFAGRSYNDLSQFPVFPWVISNYSSQVDSITRDFYKNPNNFRNLEIPVGKLNKVRFDNFKFRMQEMGSQIKQNFFLYGTFYSNPTVLYNFFIRLEPFTTLHWQHQGQKIDHADRLFSGIEEQYHSAINNTSDVKEIIPEFYYWPEFLKNRNQIDLGKKQNKEEVNNIKLPGWAKTAEEFVFKMREVLQSPQITQKLHLWIDLIFGYKTMNPKQALKWDNLFQSYTYQFDIFKQSKTEHQIKVKQLSISEFGQVPEFLFNKEHPKKKPRRGLKIDYFQDIGKFQNTCNFQIYPQGIMLCGDKYVYFLNTFLSIVDMKCESKRFDNVSIKTVLVKDKEFTWLSAKQNNLYLFNKKEILKKRLDSDIFALTSTSLLFNASGSQIIVYKVANNFVEFELTERLYGHQDQITHMVLNENIDILLTVDNDKFALLHYLSTLKYLRHFKISLNVDETIEEIRIHDMGYFLFLTSSSRILLYTFLGQLFLESDFISETDISQKLTNIQFLSEYQSLILLSTAEGNIYQIDFFDIWRFKQRFKYLPFRMKYRKNILAECCQDLEARRTELKYIDSKCKSEISYFNIIKSSNEYKGLYKIIVLYKNGDLLYFYEKAMIKEQIENTTFLRQMGMF